jgi:hypothetical protein
MGEACTTYGERRVEYTVLPENLRVRDHLEDTGIDGRLI